MVLLGRMNGSKTARIGWGGTQDSTHVSVPGAAESLNRLPVPEEAGRDTAFGRDAAGWITA